jgi:type IV pilus assembly protein PilM
MFKVADMPFVGLDIGSSAVKMVSLDTNGDGCRVVAAAMSMIKSVDGDEPSERAAIAAIEDCLKSSQGYISRDSYFVFGLSGLKKVKISSFNFALLTLEEVAQAVMLEAAQVCPFDVRSNVSVVDYQLIGTYEADGGGLRKRKGKVHPTVKGVLAVATKEAISRRQKLAEDTLLKCVLIDSDALALLNCLEKCLPSGEELPIAVVNVGRSLTTVAILGTDELPFVRDLGYSGGDIIEHIAKSSSTSAEQVQQRLSEGKGSADIDPACKRLILDITETLAYYLASRGGNAIKRVYVCGGFSLFDDFVKSLAGGIEGKVSVWNPFLQMHCDDNIAGGDLIKKCGPAFAVAAGLAMRQV